MTTTDTPKAASASVAELMHQHIVRAAEMLTSYAELVKATGKYAEMHYIPEIEFIIGELMNMSTRLAAPAASAELQRWHLIDPTGAIAATECSCIRAWSRIDGYKPTVEGLLGYEEAGWRVAPAASAEPVAEVYRGGTNTFGRATVLNRWLDGAMELADGTHLLYAHPATGTAEPVESLCDDCPPVGYPTEKTRCLPCPRRVAAPHPATAAGEQELPALPEAVGEIVGTRLTPPETREFWGYWREGYTPTTKLRVVSVEAALAYGEACALAARRLPAVAWRLIETAPPDTDLLLTWWDEWSSKWQTEVNVAVTSSTCPPRSGVSNGSAHGRATHWQPLPATPAQAGEGAG